MGILGLLAEIYSLPNLKMDLQFEIEVNWQTLNPKPYSDAVVNYGSILTFMSSKLLQLHCSWGGGECSSVQDDKQMPANMMCDAFFHLRSSIRI